MNKYIIGNSMRTKYMDCVQCNKAIEGEHLIMCVRLGYNEPPIAQNKYHIHEDCLRQNKHQLLTNDEIKQAEKDGIFL